MFRASNAYDDLVARATDENLTSENWDLNLQICDLVSSQQESGARQVVVSLTRRLAHKSANVQLLSLSLADALGKNVSPTTIYPELSSRAFCDQLVRMVHDHGGVHEKVRKRLLRLIHTWQQDMAVSADNASGYGVGAIMQDTYRELKAEHYEFEKVEPRPKTEREREEEELQRVLALSLEDQGGRPNKPSSGPDSRSTPLHQPAISLGHAATGDNTLPQNSDQSLPAEPAVPAQRVSWVRALYDFTPGEQGELGFHAGDVIRVLNTAYEHWWKGEVRKDIGIFPVNHVEVLPEPPEVERACEAATEGQTFAASKTIDELVNKLVAIDARVQEGHGLSRNLAEDDELQGLYQAALAISPQVNELLGKYQARLTDLRQLNDHYVQARTRFDELVRPTSMAVNPSAAPLNPLPQLQSPSVTQRAEAAATLPTSGPHYTGYDASVPQPPPELDLSSPEYARWYYSIFPQQAPAEG